MFSQYISYVIDYIYIVYIESILSIIIEGSLEVKLPTIWTDEKQRWEESEKRKAEERRSETDVEANLVGKKKKVREEKESEERRCRCAKR